MIKLLSTTVINSAKTAFLNNNFNTRKVKCYKLNNIISKTKFKKRKIDFLNIDTEKSEVDVLKSLNFKKYKPKLICVEIHLKDKNHRPLPLKTHPTYLYLKRKKYKIIWKKAYSFIFSPNLTFTILQLKNNAHKSTFTVINLRSYIFLILVAYLNEY